MFGPTKSIIEFTQSTTPPKGAIDCAARLIIDAVGCGIAAHSQKDIGTKRVLDYVLSQEAGPRSSILGTAHQTSPELAAMANGYLTHALDYDDYTLSSWIGHPTVVLLPALLAIAEPRELSGEDLLRGYVVGYEVGARFGLAAGGPQYALGWHNTATLGVVAATAAIGAMCQTSASTLMHALGIAASSVAGLKRNFGTQTKPLHAGMAAANAVRAIYLAEAGLSAAEDVFSGAQGLLAVLAGQRDDLLDAVVDQQLDSLGTSLTPVLGSSPILAAPIATGRSMRRAPPETRAGALRRPTKSRSRAAQRHGRYVSMMTLRRCYKASFHCLTVPSPHWPLEVVGSKISSKYRCHKNGRTGLRMSRSRFHLAMQARTGVGS